MQDFSTGTVRANLSLTRRMDGNPFDPAGQAADARCVLGREGDQVLDVGCGLGHEECGLADRVGPLGQVVGIDG